VLDGGRSVAAQLRAIATRLRGVPLGQELAELAQALEEEVKPKEVVVDSSALSDLAATLAKEREEREELRRAFALHMLDSAKREEALQAECTMLRNESPNKLQDQLSTALKEEAEISRAARRELIKEIDSLKAELASEKATARALRAEVVAYRALKGESANPMRAPRPVNGSASGIASPAQEEIERVEANKKLSEDEGDGEENSPMSPCTSSKRRLEKAGTGLFPSDAGSRRDVEFARRDFVEINRQGSATAGNWQSEIKDALDSRFRQD